MLGRMSPPPQLSAADLVRFVRLNAWPCLEQQAGERGAARDRILTRSAELLATGPRKLLQELPGLVGKNFKSFGWIWNGFYGLQTDGRLHLSYAFGPPVCNELESSGGPLTSGMCFDSMALNQTLAAFDASQWPGYVSCDATNQLGIKAGVVVPVRNAAGTPLGCWDLDSTGAIEPEDVRFMDVLVSSLARCVEFEAGSFGPGF
jgi:putative methionine-R-sulfoxide reductase with GAF domain